MLGVLGGATALGAMTGAVVVKSDFSTSFWSQIGTALLGAIVGSFAGSVYGFFGFILVAGLGNVLGEELMITLGFIGGFVIFASSVKCRWEESERRLERRKRRLESCKGTRITRHIPTRSRDCLGGDAFITDDTEARHTKVDLLRVGVSGISSLDGPVGSSALPAPNENVHLKASLPKKPLPRILDLGLAEDSDERLFGEAIAKADEDSRPLLKDAISRIDRLGWPDSNNLAEQEGEVRQCLRRVRKRSKLNRTLAISAHGNSCIACGFNFDEVYGAELSQGFIHIHHTKPLAKSGKRTPTIETDLVPLCSNCHAMVHRKKKDISIRELIYAMEAQRSD